MYPVLWASPGRDEFETCGKVMALAGKDEIARSGHCGLVDVALVSVFTPKLAYIVGDLSPIVIVDLCKPNLRL